GICLIAMSDQRRELSTRKETVNSSLMAHRSLLPLGAWALHILCDIPTHSTRFFPTPFLWPFHTPFVDGRPWGRPPFTLINYSLLLLTYLGLYAYRKRSRRLLTF